jgi:uncharacterized membrane protein
MTRPAWNFLVDCCSFVSFVALLTVTAVVQFAFPPGTAAGGHRLWGRGYDFYQAAAGVCLAVFALTILVHLIQHWTWVCNFIAVRVARWTGRPFAVNAAINTVYGVAVLICVFTLIGGVLVAAVLSMAAPPVAP